MDVLQNLLARAKARAGRIVLPEGGDERILRAARRLADEGIARPVLLGVRDALHAAAASAGVRMEGMETIDPGRSEHIDAYAASYVLGRPNANLKLAARLVRKPLFYAGMMLKCGDADALVAGAAHSSARVIEAGLMTVGLAAGFSAPSSFFLMVVPGRDGAGERTFVFADCAVNVEPDAGALADIAIASASSYRALLGGEARVALLSFSTRGSAQHARVDKVRAALELVRVRVPGLAIDGELQADAALDQMVAARKVRNASAVAGRANVLVFPDLDSGNIGYKLAQYLAGARAIGPVLQGFARPFSDLSRGASVEDIVASAAIVLAQAGGAASRH